MADIKSIQIGGRTYNVKDETARNGLGTKASIDETVHVPSAQATPVMLRNITDAQIDDFVVGDIFYDQGILYYYTGNQSESMVSIGAPSKNIVYCHKDTNKLYRWNGSAFIQVGGGGSSATVANEILNL